MKEPAVSPEAVEEQRAKTLGLPQESLEAPPTARAKTLPLAPEEPPALVPARMINEVLYCERLMYLELAQGEFADNFFTVEGRSVHKRPDRPRGDLPEPAAGGGGSAAADPAALAPRAEPEKPYQARSLWLSSDRLGITTKLDVVEGDADGQAIPIEYKRGKAPMVEDGAYLPERAQLCAQGLVLRDHGYTCDHGFIYFAASKQRVRIDFTEELVQQTLRAVARVRELLAAETLPPPLVDSPKCQGCSLSPICLPDEVNLLKRQQRAAAGTEAEAEPQDPGPLPEEGEGQEALRETGEERIRRLHPARDDRLPLYVQAQGARVGLDGETLVVTTREGDKARARLPNTSQITLLGNVQVSTQALRTCIEQDIPIAFFSTGGYFMGRAVGHDSKNVELRLAQYAVTTNPDRCLRLARGIVVAKIKNSRTLLRRNSVEADSTTLFELEQLARKAANAESIGSLLGLEGTAARVYFGAFSGMLKGTAEQLRTFDLEGRNRRPPRDPVNALLSFAYSLLTKELTHACAAVGLDPALGFYHRPHFGRPALALDLMEELRPVVADSVVLTVINTQVVDQGDFITRAGGCNLTPAGRRRVIDAFERRMDFELAHPVFGYRISTRRLLEVQARLFTRVLLGELTDYPSVRVR